MAGWPGGLGLTATHAVVYARLLLRGADLGVHGFIVQLRSLEDHSPLPGVTLGDIGPKVCCCRYVVVATAHQSHRDHNSSLTAHRSPLTAYRSPPARQVGFNDVDNGFARFERVRIPRDQMLSAFARVTDGGEYVAPAASQAKLGYLTMVHVRAGLVKSSGRAVNSHVT